MLNQKPNLKKIIKCIKILYLPYILRDLIKIFRYKVVLRLSKYGFVYFKSSNTACKTFPCVMIINYIIFCNATSFIKQSKTLKTKICWKGSVFKYWYSGQELSLSAFYKIICKTFF